MGNMKSAALISTPPYLLSGRRVAPAVESSDQDVHHADRSLQVRGPGEQQGLLLIRQAANVRHFSVGGKSTGGGSDFTPLLSGLQYQALFCRRRKYRGGQIPLLFCRDSNIRHFL